MYYQIEKVTFTAFDETTDWYPVRYASRDEAAADLARIKGFDKWAQDEGSLYSVVSCGSDDDFRGRF